MDSVDSLKINKSSKPTEEEKYLIDKYFKNSITNPESPVSEFKIILISTLLFLLMSTSYFDQFINMIPRTDNFIFRVIIKILIYIALLYIIIIMTS